MKDKKVIFFDCFGLFASDAFNNYFRTHYGEKGMEIKNRYCAYGDKGEMSLGEMLVHFQEDLGLDPQLFVEEIPSLYHINYELVELAKRLKQDHIVVLLTNVMEGTLEKVFTDVDLDSLFDLQIRSYAIHMTKPNREIYQYALSLLPKDYEKAVFFDDNPANLIPANEVGIEGILYQSPSQVEEELKKRGY